MYNFVITLLAVFGISALIANYGGPYDVFDRLKSEFKLMRCTVCLSVWVGIPIALLTDAGFASYLASVGGVILIERLT